MSTFSNFANTGRAALKGILAHPVLLVILCHAWIVDCIGDAGNPVLAPVFASLSVFVDRICKGKTGWSWILVPLYVGSCYVKALEGFDNSAEFIVICAAIIPLCYLWVERERTDLPFIRQVGASALSLLIALVYVSVLAGITTLILLSIEALFGNDVSALTEWILEFCVIFLLAPIFVSIDESRQIDGHSRILEAILNWVVSPALVIYTLLLYVYIIKIVATWTLPEGGVALMVLAFSSILFICRCYRRIQQRRPFEWFYKYSWLISIPLLVLFWVGVSRRLSDYGCTSPRYFLVVSGLIMTVLSLWHAHKDSSRFLRNACIVISAVFLAGIACPGIRHKDVSLRSQHNLTLRRAAAMGIIGDDGKFVPGIYECKDTLDAAAYRKIYQSLVAMQIIDSLSTEKFFDLENADEYLEHLPDMAKAFAVDSRHDRNHKTSDKDGIIRYDFREALDIEDYKHIVLEHTMSLSDFAALGIDIHDPHLIESQARRCGWDGVSALTFEWLEQHGNEILTFKLDNAEVVMRSLFIKMNGKEEWTISSHGDAIILFDEKNYLGFDKQKEQMK